VVHVVERRRKKRKRRREEVGVGIAHRTKCTSDPQASEKETSPSYPLINGMMVRYKTNENSVPGNLYVKYMLMFMCQDE